MKRNNKRKRDNNDGRRWYFYSTGDKKDLCSTNTETSSLQIEEPSSSSIRMESSSSSSSSSRRETPKYKPTNPLKRFPLQKSDPCSHNNNKFNKKKVKERDEPHAAPQVTTVSMKPLRFHLVSNNGPSTSSAVDSPIIGPIPTVNVATKGCACLSLCDDRSPPCTTTRTGTDGFKAQWSTSSGSMPNVQHQFLDFDYVPFHSISELSSFQASFSSYDQQNSSVARSILGSRMNAIRCNEPTQKMHKVQYLSSSVTLLERPLEKNTDGRCSSIQATSSSGVAYNQMDTSPVTKIVLSAASTLNEERNERNNGEEIERKKKNCKKIAICNLLNS
jgi:hypothetical protein